MRLKIFAILAFEAISAAKKNSIKSPCLDKQGQKKCLKTVKKDFRACKKACSSRKCKIDCRQEKSANFRKCPCFTTYITAMCHTSPQAVGQNRYSYLISSSGDNKIDRHYTIPPKTWDWMTDYLFLSGFSIMNGEVYIFGGDQDEKKISKLIKCAIVDTGKRLKSPFVLGSLVTLKEKKEKVILCNGSADPRKCESFDGKRIKRIGKTNIQHNHACMALNDQGRPTIIAGIETSSVEIFQTSGWQNAKPHPAGEIYGATCASVSNGIITVGGYSWATGDLKEVYLFRNGKWSVAGQMHHVKYILKKYLKRFLVPRLRDNHCFRQFLHCFWRSFRPTVSY
ncbi:unnamed protein product [Oikopleura dioica]|uniref:Uncharacterized protein n=1 Tax=Oikopleura dioica TaxID=34765 RepID=E4XNE9_OIKDI|nr:unnamed protein product [Oikopleura dioica]